MIATSANLWTRIFSSFDCWTWISISRHLLSLHHSPMQHCSSVFISFFRSTVFLFLLGFPITILPVLRPCARPTATFGPSSESSSVSAAAEASVIPTKTATASPVPASALGSSVVILRPADGAPAHNAASSQYAHHRVHGRLTEALRLLHLLQSGFIGLGLGLGDGLAAQENLQTKAYS